MPAGYMQIDQKMNEEEKRGGGLKLGQPQRQGLRGCELTSSSCHASRMGKESPPPQFRINSILAPAS